MHDKRDEVDGSFCKTDLCLERLRLAVRRAEVQHWAAVCTALADMIDVPIRHRLQDGLHRILATWCDGGHVRRLPLVSLIAQFAPETLQDIEVVVFEELGQALPTDVAEERDEILEGLIRLVDDEVQVQKGDREALVCEARTGGVGRGPCSTEAAHPRWGPASRGTPDGVAAVCGLSLPRGSQDA